ncbi:MAG TPA: glycerate kinase [Gammaproteobacteria bacterium]|nr:glycerate kinase [Gammaproteobacteria bacterium]
MAQTKAIDDPLAFLIELFESAVGAADPRQVLADYLPADTDRRAIVIGAGKAAASMAVSLERNWQGPLSGLVVTRYGHSLSCERIEVVEASHPVPDDMGEVVARRMLAMVDGLGADDLVICLISGGGSSLLSLPAPGLTLADKQQINKALLKSGASIGEMNCVRKHLSAIKGGRLAAACSPAQIITYAISDVPRDEATVIASGPTVADPTSAAEAISILEKYAIDVSAAVSDWLRSDAAETLKHGDSALKNTRFHMIATPYQALQAAKAKVMQTGLPVLVLGDDIEGESREVAKVHAAIARSIQKHGEPLSAPCVILSGGETTVTVKGSGRGGRNAEFLLSMANCLRGQKGIFALAADTDGIDGSEDNAGAVLSPDSWQRGMDKGLDTEASLENNDGYSYFEALGDLLITGPTLTNVNDFRALLVLPEDA